MSAETSRRGLFRRDFSAPLRYQADGDDAEVLFADNDGAGLFRLVLPIEIDDDCWNSGDDVEDHVACAAAVTLERVGPSEPAASNDGMNCPAYASEAPTYLPSYTPTRVTPRG